MTHNTPHHIATLVRAFNGDNWSDLVDRGRSLNSHQKIQLLEYLVEELRFADEEKQAWIIYLMMKVDPEKVVSYVDTIIRTAPSILIKRYICWFLEAGADAQWIPTLSHILFYETDEALLDAASAVLSTIDDPKVVLILDRAAQSNL